MNKTMTYPKTNNCLVHYWCCRGFDDAESSREPLAAVGAAAAAVEVVPGSAECRAIGAEAGPGG